MPTSAQRADALLATVAVTAVRVATGSTSAKPPPELQAPSRPPAPLPPVVQYEHPIERFAGPGAVQVLRNGQRRRDRRFRLAAERVFIERFLWGCISAGYVLRELAAEHARTYLHMVTFRYELVSPCSNGEIGKAVTRALYRMISRQEIEQQRATGILRFYDASDPDWLHRADDWRDYLEID